MMEIMYHLEPRKELENTIIFNEMDEVNEILFFQSGSHDIGYELQGLQKYVLRYGSTNPIGAYGVTFNKRS